MTLINPENIQKTTKKYKVYTPDKQSFEYFCTMEDVQKWCKTNNYSIDTWTNTEPINEVITFKIMTTSYIVWSVIFGVLAAVGLVYLINFICPHFFSF